MQIAQRVRQADNKRANEVKLEQEKLEFTFPTLQKQTKTKKQSAKEAKSRWSFWSGLTRAKSRQKGDK